VDERTDFLQLGVAGRFVFRQFRGVDLERLAGPVVVQDFPVPGDDFAFLRKFFVR
jgi:hypothetical protein